jgi:hypothetical protein
MADDPGEGIYRAMLEGDDGLPVIGASAETLGVRLNKDLIPDAFGMVHRPNFTPGEANGLSCAPTIPDLPHFVLPRAWGGRNKRTVIWRIDAADLGSDCLAVEDSDPGKPKRHISIGPARSMPFDDCARLIEATRPKWKKVTKQLRLPCCSSKSF